MKTKGEKIAFKLGEMASNKLTPFTYGLELGRKYGFSRIPSTESVGSRAVSEGSIDIDSGFVAEKIQKAGKIALVGKGITFDTGGYSIKPYAGMVGMKYDMMGSAVSLGALVDLGPTADVQVHLCVAENRISSTALLPDSELVYADGTVVIVTDTDAEGRLVLADGIIRARKNGAKVIITTATLTGAVVAALGEQTVGVFSNNDTLAAEAIKAIDSTGIKGWRMPFLDSKAIKKLYKGTKLINWQSGHDLPGHSYAASFLAHFAKDTPFLHLDIAGVATESHHSKARTEMVVALTKLVKALETQKWV